MGSVLNDTTNSHSSLPIAQQHTHSFHEREHASSQSRENKKYAYQLDQLPLQPQICDLNRTCQSDRIHRNGLHRYLSMAGVTSLGCYPEWSGGLGMPSTGPHRSGRMPELHTPHRAGGSSMPTHFHGAGGVHHPSHGRPSYGGHSTLSSASLLSFASLSP